MAFKIGNQTVIRDIDATAAIETNSNLDKLQINGTDVLTHDGSTITLKNVNIDDLMESSINTDNVTEGSTNLFHTTARVEQIINANNQTLTFADPLLTISNGNTVNLSSLSPNLTGYATESYVDQAEYDARSYTDQREIVITSAYRSYADQAESDAISTAMSQASIDATNKANAAKSQAVSQASADATSKANAARSGAELYTDTREIAITTAYESYANSGDTTTYNAAKSYTDTEITTVLPLTGGTLTGALTLSGAPTSADNAATKSYVDSAISGGTGALDTDDISEASNLYYTDARVNTLLGTKGYATESYADQAEADAISTASTDATTKSDQALVDAKAYTDTRETAITTAYETYADTAEVDAVLTANAYTDTRETAITTAYQTYADQAEVDAKAYTDTEIAAIVDGAPGTLDTLNELAAALGDDANLSTTLSTQIGTKLATADFNSTADAWLGSNLYYTDERVDDRVSNLLVAGSNITLTYNDSLNTMTIASATTASGGYDLSSNTTDDVTEGANNLYFTSARVDTVFSGKTTSDLTEGTNLYHTNARVDARIPTNVSSFTNDSGYITSFTDTNTTYTAGTGLNLVGTTFNNTAPDQTVSLTGSGATSISGTYPNFTISSTDTNTNTTYSTATSSTLGLVKIGYSENGKNYPVELSSGKMYVNVPWVDTNTDTNTTYSDGNGIGLSSTTFSVSAGNGLTQEADGLKMSGSYTGTFTASGDICAYSDKRLKRNIQTIDNALDTVHNLRGVTFEKSLKPSIGVIAQEVEEVLPELVNTDADGMKSVAYGNIVGVLIEAIKEQQKQIEELKNKFKDL